MSKKSRRVKTQLDSSSRFDVTPTCDRQTDRQTDRHRSRTAANTLLAYSRAGKIRSMRTYMNAPRNVLFAGSLRKELLHIRSADCRQSGSLRHLRLLSFLDDYVSNAIVQYRESTFATDNHSRLAEITTSQPPAVCIAARMPENRTRRFREQNIRVNIFRWL